MATERIAQRPSAGSGATRLTPSSLTATLTAHRTITAAELDAHTVFAFDPGGAARNCVLPAEADSAGAFLIIANTADAAEIITVQSDAPATVCTPTQSESAILFCDGTSWFGIVGASV